MQRIHSFLVLAAALAALAASTVLFAQPKTSPQVPSPSVNAPPAGASAQQVERGRYLVALGDCVACHTQQGGARFAGGRAVETPFGRLLSANITPDGETGIGKYTADDFYRALHEGIDRQGRHLYPAFPYNYYTQVTREDADAMYAYMRTVPAVRSAVHTNQLPFPFNIRQLMIGWNWIFLDKGPYRPDASKPAQWNRGAYLAEGLGHCQACHTPKNLLGAARGGKAYQGGAFGEWFAPDLTGNTRTGLGAWKDEKELREFLRLGMNAHSAASGEMGEVVAFSTSAMDDADLDALVSYLRTLPASPEAHPDVPDPAAMRAGQAIWQDSCAACHRMDGSGVPRFFPPLARNANVQQSDPSTPIRFVLAGTRKVPTDRAPTPLAMPAYQWKLSDAQVAAVLTYVRNSWGNAAQPVKPEQVAEMRGKLPLQLHPDSAQPAANLSNPGPQTLVRAGTDSRQNGTAQAGQEAPKDLHIETAAGRTGQGGGGHSGGAPTRGPG